MTTKAPLLVGSLDHIVLTVASIPETIEFYERVLGLEARMFNPGRYALHFGNQKINLHEVGRVVDSNVKHATPGSADICFLASQPFDKIMTHLAEQNVRVIQGPVGATGARKKLQSIYFYDPDENLIEVASEV
jgi:catechol 2,3-dioxygenase-like lactoylglutathione lyase family enzyme